MREGVEGLLRDKTRPSRVAPLPVAERVVALTQTDPPGERSHWTGVTMARAVGIGVSSVQRIWRAHGLHRLVLGSDREAAINGLPKTSMRVRRITRRVSCEMF